MNSRRPRVEPATNSHRKPLPLLSLTFPLTS